MKFLIDAQLPHMVVQILRAKNHDVIHTTDLPLGNRTTDDTISKISLSEKRIVVTKDADFVNSFFLKGKPHKLLLISTGNIGNHDLAAILELYQSQIIAAFESSSFVELRRNSLIVHE